MGGVDIRVATMGKRGSLNELRWTDADIAAVASLAHLQSLSLMPFYALQVSDLSPLTRCSELRSLALRSLAVVQPSTLALLTQLRVLHLGHDHVNAIPLDLGQGVGRLQNLQALTLALHCASHLNLAALGGLRQLHTLSLTATRFALPMDLPSDSFPALRNLRINLPLRWGVADMATAPVTELLANLLPICGLRTLILTGPGLINIDGAMLVRCLLTQPPLDTLCLAHAKKLTAADMQALIAHHAETTTEDGAPRLLMMGWAEHMLRLATASPSHNHHHYHHGGHHHHHDPAALLAHAPPCCALLTLTIPGSL
ncbi:MAG: hypothetical protein WDW36_007097 [Sanguina aurantia]